MTEMKAPYTEWNARGRRALRAVRDKADVGVTLACMAAMVVLGLGGHNEAAGLFAIAGILSDRLVRR